MQAKPAQHGFEEEIAQASGGAEEARRGAGQLRHHLLCRGDIAHLPRWAKQREVMAMVQAVVFHGVPAPRDLAYQRGVPRGARADAEERGLHPVLVQQVQHARRHLGIGPIVEAQGHAALCRWRERQQVRSQPGTARPQPGRRQQQVRGDHAAGSPRQGRGLRDDGRGSAGM